MNSRINCRSWEMQTSPAVSSNNSENSEPPEAYSGKNNHMLLKLLRLLCRWEFPKLTSMHNTMFIKREVTKLCLFEKSKSHKLFTSLFPCKY